MDAFALYRLPRDGHCTLVGQNGVPSRLTSLEQLGDGCGFVIAPFTASDDMPALLLAPDDVRQFDCNNVAVIDDYLPFYMDSGHLALNTVDREVYHEDFCRFQRAFSATGIQKLVLARCADVGHKGTHPTALFARACELYPDAFVTLFSAPHCGTWLMATPEVLLAHGGGRWHTMALAGTMRYSDEALSWSEKNIQEQAYVARYIKDCLDLYSNDVEMTAPYTTRAGILAHLRTDFSFTMTDQARLGALLNALHPTPAVCGFPKLESHRFILENETVDRSYYSGFSGPLHLGDDTAMFVSLRCMRILDDRYRLYAGGGILPQSEENLEWAETEAKMQAMLSLIEE